MSLLGVDLGTSRCKAVTFSPTGQVLASAESSYSPLYPRPGFVEMAPAELWEAFSLAVRTATAATDDPVEALAISTHGETFVPVDKAGQPVGAAVMNADNRALGEAQELGQTLGKEGIFALTGQVVHPMYSLPKIMWLRKHEPERFDSIARFLSAGGYLLSRMGLPPLVDHSHASRYMAFDIHRRAWSPELLEAAGVPPDRMPDAVPAGTAAGRLAGAAAAELGLPQGTLVAVAGHDQLCGAVGVGVIEPGAVSDSLGTYECMLAVSAQPTLADTALAASLNSYCHVVPDRYVTLAFFPSGIMTSWFVSLLAGEGDPTPLYGELETAAPAGPTGLSITPHLIGSFNPHWDPLATGVIHGLTPGVGRGHLYKGILEGLACELALNAGIMRGLVGEFPTLRVTGGGTRSGLGLRLRAALTGLRLETLECPEAVCLGSALLAGVAAGTYRSLEAAVGATVRVAATIEPDTDEAAAYAPQLRRYRALYQALEPMRRESALA